MIFFESPEINIEWDEMDKLVIMEWKGFVIGEKFRNAVDKGLELLIEKRGSKWLADLTTMGVISQQDQKWADEDWFPRAAKSGIRYMAMITPEKMISKMSVRNVINKVGDLEIETEYFGSREEAKTWLRSRQA